MDPKLVAAKQRGEVAYIAKRFKCSQKTVRDVQKKVGRSRGKVYAALKELGYVLHKVK